MRLGLFAILFLLAILRTASEHPAFAEEELRLLAFGDSLVHGYGLDSASTFPVQLERALRQKGWSAKVINAGNSGDTTSAGLQRLDWSLAEQPDAVLLELGANDALRGLEPDLVRANLERILTRLHAEGLPVLLVGMRAPRNLGADYGREFDAIFPELAKAHNVDFYPFFLEGVALEPSLNQADGIHPNATGVGIIVEEILPFVETLLTRAAADKTAESGKTNN